MSQEITRPLGKVTIYAAGGGGINISALYSGHTDLSPLSAIVHTAFIDTSNANIIKNGIPEEEMYLISAQDLTETIDGSGKVRSENVQHILPHIPRILHNHVPGDLSIVVFTAGGGSGSVIGPLLIAELIERGKDVIGVVIGVKEDDLSIENTLNTFKSLESTVDSFGRVVNIHTIIHEPGQSRSDVNERAQFFISSVCIAASRRNDELDTKDVSRWLNYNTIPRSDLQPALTLVDCFLEVEDVHKERPNAFAMINVLRTPDESIVDAPMAFIKSGYLPTSEAKGHNLYFTSDVSGLDKLIADLRNSQKLIAEKRVVRQSAGRFLDASDKSSGKGLVL